MPDSLPPGSITKMAYKYRHKETYKGTKIDVKAHTSADLIRKVTAKKEAIDRSVIDGSVMLSAFGDTFLEATKRSTVSESWYYDLCHIWSSIIREFGDRKMEDVRALDLQQYLDTLKVADGTIKKRYDLICQVMRYAHINGVTATDLSVGLVRPRGTATKNGRSLTDRERLLLLSVLDGHRGELFCKLMLYCGLRPSEAQALNWKDIDLSARTVTVDKAMKPDGKIGPPKTLSAYRTIPIPEHFARTLRRNRSTGPMFSHNPRWRRRMWDNIRREMNIAMGAVVYRNELKTHPLADDFNLYNLRHTYCTDLEKMGVPISIASRFMGHSNINITAKIYTHASTEAIEIGRKIINKGETTGETIPQTAQPSQMTTDWQS